MFSGIFKTLTADELKAPALISSTVEGKVNSETVLLSKAYSPIIFKPSFKLIVLILLTVEKAYWPTSTILEGRVIEVTLLFL